MRQVNFSTFQPFNFLTLVVDSMTSLAPLHPPEISQAYVRGDVTVHPTAAIAPGVLLQAEAGSQIAISSGVCIGMGSILHAYQGKIEIGESANLGAGVLVVGQVQIGALACIGSSSTLFNTSIQPAQMVPPGSLIGDTSRQVSLDTKLDAKLETSSEPGPSIADTTVVPAAPASTPPESQEPSETAAQPSDAANHTTNVHVYGQAYLNQLLVTLLPHRQALEQPLPDQPSPPNDS